MSSKVQESKQQSRADVEAVMHPTIDETSKRIVEEKLTDRKGKPTHERLYDLNKEKQEKLRQRQEEERERVRQSVEVSHHISQSVNVHNQSTRQREKPLD